MEWITLISHYRGHKFWDEVVGVFNGLTLIESNISVTIGRLEIVFPIDSPEAEILKKALNKRSLGGKVAILRTDLPDTPLRIRIFDATEMETSL